MNWYTAEDKAESVREVVLEVPQPNPIESKFGMLMLLAAMIGDGSLEGPSVRWIGAVYFTLLAGVELYRVVEIPGELATGRRIDGSTDRGGV